ncbi:MAG: hypothetical protein ABEI78_02115 [Candidatus Nanohaloarchaea archaeon]
MKITEFKVPSKTGGTRTIEFHKKNQKVIQRIKKGDRVTKDITYDQKTFQKLFQAMFNVDTHFKQANQGRQKTRTPIKKADLDTQTKKQYLIDLADSINKKEEKQLKEEMKNEDKETRKKLIKMGGVKPYSEKNWQKTKEQVLQLIADSEISGGDLKRWFTSKEFKDIFYSNYDVPDNKRRHLKDLRHLYQQKKLRKREAHKI